MIPIIDDYLQTLIINRLRFLKEHLVLIDYIFQTGNPETKKRLKTLLTNQKLRVVIGFPREQTTLPAYVITLAPEQEQPAGLGDNYDIFGEDEYDTDDALTVTQKFLDRSLSSTFMNATYRIECWSDNGDLTAYMHSILKWCLFTSRKDMLQAGWNNIVISGTDLEPVPDYMPIFVYRRAAQVTLIYEAKYHDNLESLKDFFEVVSDPENYIKTESGDITDKDGVMILPCYSSITLDTKS